MKIQIAQTPTEMPSAKTELLPVFASDSVLVKKEQEAFSFASLVADCGGCLGLFIGFNFLMIWDWIVILLERLATSNKLGCNK